MKACLCSTMTQTRLNSCMLLHTYKDIADKLDAEKVVKSFVDGHTDRKKNCCDNLIYYSSSYDF